MLDNDDDNDYEMILYVNGLLLNKYMYVYTRERMWIYIKKVENHNLARHYCIYYL